MTQLPRYTWDQAAILGLATARGFTALGIPAATVRKWASRGHVEPAGKAPGGAKLYPISTVTRQAERANVTETSNPHKDVSHLDDSRRPILKRGNGRLSHVGMATPA